MEKFKRKLKALCKRNWGIDLTHRIKKINEVTRGWINYFRIGSMKQKLERIDGQMRVRMIAIIWKQWKTRAKRVWGLRKLGIEKRQAILMAGMGNRYMVVAHNPTLKQAITRQL